MIMRIRKSLRLKMLLILLAAMALPPSILCAVLYASATNITESNFIEYSEKYLRQVSQNIDHNIKYMDMVSMMAFMDKGVIEVLGDDMKEGSVKTPYKQSVMDEFLSKASEIISGVSGVYLFSETNYYYKSKLDVRVDNDYEYKLDKWYENALSSDGVITLIGAHAPYQSKSSTHYVFSMARSIIDPHSVKRVGVMLIDMEVETLNRVASVSSVYDGSWLVITDEEGRVIYSPNQSEITQTLEIESGDYIGTRSGAFFVEMDGELMLANHITSSYTGWKIIQLIPASLVYSTSNMIAIAITITVPALVLLAAAVSYYGSRRIVKPVLTLCDMVAEIGGGDFRKRDGITGYDEISELYSGVNNMAIRLGELIDRVTTVRLKQREAELELLQSQVNPHFLHNALNSVYMTAIINDDAEVADMVDKLSLFYKMSTPGRATFVTVRDELSLARSYLDVVKARFGERLAYSVQVGQDALDIYCIKLILQPLVENAVVHGLENKMQGVEIRISARVEGRSLTLEVADNGNGIPPERLSGLQRVLKAAGRDGAKKNESGIGLLNVHERIRLFFGDEYGIDIQSAPGQGTRITARLPALDAPPAAPYQISE